MTMTENSSLGPIDLSVPKSKSSCSETSREPQYPSIPRIFPKDSQPIPNFNGYTTAAHPYLNHTERWLIQNTICSEPVVLKKSIKRSMSPENGFKRSNASPDNSSGGLEGLKIKNFQRNQLEVNSEMQGVKRRPSDCSTSSSISSFDQDSNNNENLGFKKFTTKRTDESLSPEEKKPRTILNGTVNAEESFIKREITTPEQSRLGSSPASSFTSETDNPCDSSSTRGRPTRPFKAITSGMIIDPIPLQGPLGDFETFRQNILSKVSSNKSTNHNMRRQGNAANTHITDPAYWEKRRKNNEAAKRSRDARRRKEDEVAIRCAYLEQERILMLQENRMLRETLEKYQQYGLIR